MARGTHAPAGRAFPWVIVSLLAAALAGGAVVALLNLSGDGNAAEEEPTPRFSFSVGRVGAVAVDKEATATVPKQTVRQVRQVLDRLYTIGFVDPDEWRSGTFPALPELFAEAAAERMDRDLEDLTLGSAAAGVDRVEPGPSKLKLSFLLDEAQQPLTAIAQATFRASGTATDGRSLTIIHGGRYLLELSAGEWRIVGYQVDGEMAPAGPAAGPTAGETP